MMSSKQTHFDNGKSPINGGLQLGKLSVIGLFLFHHYFQGYVQDYSCLKNVHGYRTSHTLERLERVALC